MSCHVMSCHVMSCHVMSCHVMSCHVMSCHVMSCHVMSYHIISYHIISYHIISYHIISYHIISYYVILCYIYIKHTHTHTHICTHMLIYITLISITIIRPAWVSRVNPLEPANPLLLPLATLVARQHSSLALAPGPLGAMQEQLAHFVLLPAILPAVLLVLSIVVAVPKACCTRSQVRPLDGGPEVWEWHCHPQVFSGEHGLGNDSQYSPRRRQRPGPAKFRTGISVWSTGYGHPWHESCKDCHVAMASLCSCATGRQNKHDEFSKSMPPTLQRCGRPCPLCDIPSGCCFFTGPWTVTRSSLRMLRWVAAF